MLLVVLGTSYSHCFSWDLTNMFLNFSTEFVCSQPLVVYCFV